MRYTETKEFTFGSMIESRAIVVDGSVTINAWYGNAWVLSETITTGTAEIFTRNTNLQIVPDVSSSYWIDETGGY